MRNAIDPRRIAPCIVHRSSHPAPKLPPVSNPGTGGEIGGVPSEPQDNPKITE